MVCDVSCYTLLVEFAWIFHLSTLPSLKVDLLLAVVDLPADTADPRRVTPDEDVLHREAEVDDHRPLHADRGLGKPCRW